MRPGEPDKAVSVPCKPLRGITKKASPLVNTGTFAKNRLFWLLFENAPESSVYQRVKI